MLINNFTDKEKFYGITRKNECETAGSKAEKEDDPFCRGDSDYSDYDSSIISGNE